MKIVSALGLLAGGFVLVPKGVWVFVALWGLAKVEQRWSRNFGPFCPPSAPMEQFCVIA